MKFEGGFGLPYILFRIHEKAYLYVKWAYFDHRLGENCAIILVIY